MHRLRSSINAIPKGSHSKWVDDLLARYEERKRRWEIRKASLWQDRADALVKCMKSVLHVVTLNMGISLPRESEENILSAMQVAFARLALPPLNSMPDCMRNTAQLHRKRERILAQIASCDRGAANPSPREDGTTIYLPRFVIALFGHSSSAAQNAVRGNGEWETL